MRQDLHQGNRQRDVRHHRDDRDFDRCLGVLAREEARGQRLDQHVGRKTGGEGRQRACRCFGGGGIERAALEQDGHDRARHGDQRRRCRQGKGQREFDRPVLAAERRVRLAGAQLPCQQRQQGNADRDADDAEGQLVHTVGVIEERDRALAQGRGEDDIDHHIHLHHAGAQQGRRHQHQQSLHPRGEPRPGRHEHDVGPLAGVGDPYQLRQAGDRNTPGQRMSRIRQQFGPHTEQNADQYDIEHDGRRRGRGETLQRVQHAAHQRDQRHEGQVGKGEAGEIDGEAELDRLVYEPRREREHQPGHGQYRGQGKNQQHGAEYGGDLGGELHRRVPSVGRQPPREQRHEGRVEGALGEQAAEEIGELECDEEGVSDQPRADDVGDQHVAREAEHTADHGPAADRRDGSEKRHEPILRVIRGANKAGKLPQTI